MTQGLGLEGEAPRVWVIGLGSGSDWVGLCGSGSGSQAYRLTGVGSQAWALSQVWAQAWAQGLDSGLAMGLGSGAQAQGVWA